MEHSPIQIPAPDVLSAVPAPLIAAAIDQLIEALDDQQGDPDLEETGIEDSFMPFPGNGPGCHVSDPGDYAVPEWDTRGRHKEPSIRLKPGVWGYHEDYEDDDPLEVTLCERHHGSQVWPAGANVPDDAEDDDPGGGNVTDEPHDGDQEGGEPHSTAAPRYGIDQSKGPLPAAQIRALTPPRPAPPPVPPEAEVRLEDLPEVYASVARGKCLEPVHMDGACLVFSTSERPEPGDFVGVWFKPGTLPSDQPQRWVKKLVSAGPPGLTFFDMTPACEVSPFVTLEMLNPPRRFVVPAHRITAIHKVIGEAESMGGGRARVAASVLPAGIT